MEEHEDPAAFLKSISAKQAGWMARHIEQRVQQDSETLGMDVESELAVSIRSSDGCQRFTVVARIFRTERSSVSDFAVKDGCLDKKSALRTGQVTVWDADEIKKDAVREGKRYLFCHALGKVLRWLTRLQILFRLWLEPGLEGQVFFRPAGIRNGL